MKTPQQPYPKLAQALGIPELYLKREDLHPYGSHKGRSIPFMIKRYAKDGIRKFVVSSSGNAALAAVRTAAQHNKNNPQKEIQMIVYVGAHIDPTKINNLKSEICNLKSISIETVDRPKQTAFQIEKESAGKIKNLRQSADDVALEGYLELAQELNKIPNLQAIFIPTSSGTTAQALSQAFIALNQHPQIHIVQTTACHPFVDSIRFNNQTPLLLEPALSLSKGAGVRSPGVALAKREGEVQSETQSAPNHSIAGAIIDNIAHRKEKVADLIKQSGGAGWIVTDEEIKEAMKLVKQTTNLEISPNSALSVAGLKKAIANGFIPSGPAVCLITGP